MSSERPCLTGWGGEGLTLLPGPAAHEACHHLGDVCSLPSPPSTPRTAKLPWPAEREARGRGSGLQRKSSVFHIQHQMPRFSCKKGKKEQVRTRSFPVGLVMRAYVQLTPAHGVRSSCVLGLHTGEFYCKDQYPS